MSYNSFSGGATVDKIALKLQQISHYILLVVFGLLPILFLPTPAASLSYTKIFFVIGALFIALVFYSLSVLRSGTITFRFSYALYGLWAIAAVALLSGLLSGDLHDSFIGSDFNIHTAAFVGLMALVASVWMLVNPQKDMIIRLYFLLVFSTLVLVLYHVVRVFFGADALSFGVFGSATASLIGGWNDLALFLGLTVLIGLVTLEQLPLTKIGRILFGIVIAGSLIMLAVINFFFVWAILALVSLVMLVYSLGKDRFMGPSAIQSAVPGSSEKSTLGLFVSVAVFIVSTLFVIGGAGIGSFMSQATGISYIEVRPSVGATADIARSVYAENAFLGAGTNRFGDAWRLYKDPSINVTAFWNTTFQSGSGYVPTFFVTNGILGFLAWIFFFGALLWGGMRMLLAERNTDRVWYFIGTSAFVGAIYIWGMTLVYVPGATMLLLAALFTGITCLAANAMNPQSVHTLSVGTSRRTGFLLTLVVMAVIVTSVGSLYFFGRHYASSYIFVESVLSQQPGVAIDEIESGIVNAYTLSADDLFARRIAEYQLARMNSILALPEPNETQQQVFQSAIANGVSAARLAADRDPTDPQNWSVLGTIYSILASLQVEGSFDLAKQALERASELDPQNPTHALQLAQLEGRAGNIDASRSHASDAVALKPNYSDALFFLSQLEIAQGDIDSAIGAAQSIISFEPQNATRYYQLGVLYAAKQDAAAAAGAFEAAVQLDPNFANARYFLALAYNDLERPADAKVQLERVLETNPDNAQVRNLIEQLDANGAIFVPPANTGTERQPVSEEPQVTTDDSTVITTEAPDTSLVTPINTPPAVEDTTQTATPQANDADVETGS